MVIPFGVIRKLHKKVVLQNSKVLNSGTLDKQVSGGKNGCIKKILYLSHLPEYATGCQGGQLYTLCSKIQDLSVVWLLFYAGSPLFG